MFEIDYKNLKKNVAARIVLVVGLAFTLIFGIIMGVTLVKKSSMNREAKATYIEENGYTDDDGDYLYSPIYHFTVDGKEYVCKSSFSASKRPSETGIVYYQKGNPNKCMTDYENGSNWIFIIGIIIGVVIVGAGIFMIIKKKKVINKVKYLATHGKLIKGIPYTMEDTGTIINGKHVQRIVINYTLPNGTTIPLRGNPRYDYKSYDDDYLVDLLIDPNDSNNYYIDFEIKYSGDVQVEKYNGPMPTPNQGIDPRVMQAANTIQSVASVVQGVENTINAVNDIANSSTTITIGKDNNQGE